MVGSSAAASKANINANIEGTNDMGRAANTIYQARAATFNDRAYALIVTILDEAEEWLVRNKRCEPHEAIDVLTRYYIECVGSVIGGGSVYLPSEESAGADIFLWRVCPKEHRKTFERNARMLSEHLSTHTTTYFPNYVPIIHLALLEKIERTNNPFELRSNGVVLLAVASVPGATASVRRELRRRGLKNEPLLISATNIEKRIGRHGTLNLRKTAPVPDFYIDD